jgi:hypothetical protein
MEEITKRLDLEYCYSLKSCFDDELQWIIRFEVLDKDSGWTLESVQDKGLYLGIQIGSPEKDLIDSENRQVLAGSEKFLWAIRPDDENPKAYRQASFCSTTSVLLKYFASRILVSGSNMNIALGDEGNPTDGTLVTLGDSYSLFTKIIGANFYDIEKSGGTHQTWKIVEEPSAIRFLSSPFAASVEFVSRFIPCSVL